MIFCHEKGKEPHDQLQKAIDDGNIQTEADLMHGIKSAESKGVSAMSKKTTMRVKKEKVVISSKIVKRETRSDSAKKGSAKAPKITALKKRLDSARSRSKSSAKKSASVKSAKKIKTEPVPAAKKRLTKASAKKSPTSKKELSLLEGVQAAVKVETEVKVEASAASSQKRKSSAKRSGKK